MRHLHKSDNSPTRHNWPGSACTVTDPDIISPWQHKVDLDKIFTCKIPCR